MSAFLLDRPRVPYFPKNTDISRGHTADCPNMETHFPWVCECHAREKATPMWLRELRRDKREQVL